MPKNQKKFLLFKYDIMKKATQTAFLLFLWGSIWSCIPIEDRLNPNILAVQLEDTYSVQDTMFIPVDYSDNEQLDSFVVSIRKIDGTIRNPWNYQKIDTIRGGRRYKDTLQIPIPINVDTGRYEIEFECYDFSKNMARTSASFLVQSDRRGPQIREFKIVGLSQDQNGNYLTCRLEVINIEGLVTDNTGIKLIRASLSNLISPARITDSDSISFTNLFERDLRIPNTVKDGEILTLKLTVIDENNNTASQEARFLIGCDDSPPQVIIENTSPEIGANQEVNLVEGTTLKIQDGYITDNSQLQRLAVTFNPLNAVRDTVFSINLTNNPTDTIFLNTLPKTANTFTLPQDASSGDTYELIYFALDTAQNTAKPIRILVNVIKDDIPSIFVTNAYTNDIELDLNADSLFIGAGEELQVEGKIEEDKSLQYIRIYWGLKGFTSLQREILGENITELPFDLSDLQSLNTFRVPTIIDTGRVYELRIEAKDTKNSPTIVQYFFHIR